MAGGCFYRFNLRLGQERWSIDGKAWTAPKPIGTALGDLLSFPYHELCLSSCKEDVSVLSILPKQGGAYLKEGADQTTLEVLRSLSVMLPPQPYFQPRVEDVVRFEKIIQVLRTQAATLRAGRYVNLAEAFRTQCEDQTGLRLTPQKVKPGQAMAAKLVQLSDSISGSYESSGFLKKEIRATDFANVDVAPRSIKVGPKGARRAKWNEAAQLADIISLPVFSSEGYRKRMFGTRSPLGRLLKNCLIPLRNRVNAQREISLRYSGDPSKSEAFELFDRLLEMAIRHNRQEPLAEKDEALSEAITCEHRANACSYYAETVSEALLATAHAHLSAGGHIFVCPECAQPFMRKEGAPRSIYCSAPCRNEAAKRQANLPQPGCVAANITRKANAKRSAIEPEVKRLFRDLAELVSSAGPLYRRHCDEETYREWLRCVGKISREEIRSSVERSGEGPYPIIWHGEIISQASDSSPEDLERFHIVKSSVKAYLERADQEKLERRQTALGIGRRESYKRQMLPSELPGLDTGPYAMASLSAIRRQQFLEKKFRWMMKRHEAQRIVEREESSAPSESANPLHLLLDESDIPHLADAMLSAASQSIEELHPTVQAALRELVSAILSMYCEHHKVFTLRSGRVWWAGEDFSLKAAAEMLASLIAEDGPLSDAPLRRLEGTLQSFLEGAIYDKETHRMVASRNRVSHDDGLTSRYWARFVSYGYQFQKAALGACVRVFEHAANPLVLKGLFNVLANFHLHATFYYKAIERKDEDLPAEERSIEKLLAGSVPEPAETNAHTPKQTRQTALAEQ